MLAAIFMFSLITICGVMLLFQMEIVQYIINLSGHQCVHSIFQFGFWSLIELKFKF